MGQKRRVNGYQQGQNRKPNKKVGSRLSPLDKIKKYKCDEAAAVFQSVKGFIRKVNSLERRSIELMREYIWTTEEKSRFVRIQELYARRVHASGRISPGRMDTIRMLVKKFNSLARKAYDFHNKKLWRAQEILASKLAFIDGWLNMFEERWKFIAEATDVTQLQALSALRTEGMNTTLNVDLDDLEHAWEQMALVHRMEKCTKLLRVFVDPQNN